MYSLELKAKVAKVFLQLEKKDKERLRRIYKKISRILKNPYFYKQLKGDLHGSRRVHINPHVLIYDIDEKRRIVTILDYDHHDNIY